MINTVNLNKFQDLFGKSILLCQIIFMAVKFEFTRNRRNKK